MTRAGTVLFTYGGKYRNQRLATIPLDYLDASLSWELADDLRINVQREIAYRRRNDSPADAAYWHSIRGSRDTTGGDRADRPRVRRGRMRDPAYRVRQIQRLANSLRRQAQTEHTPAADRTWCLAVADALMALLRSATGGEPPAGAGAGSGRAASSESARPARSADAGRDQGGAASERRGGGQ